MNSVLSRFVGALLLTVPFLPLARWFPGASDISTVVPPHEWLLGLFISGALAWLTTLVLQSRSQEIGRWSRFTARSDCLVPAGVLLALAALLLVVSSAVFQHRPLLADSMAQLFQATILAGGAAVAPLPPEGGFFTVQQMVEGATGWYAQYPPGHSALLALGVLADVPWLVPIALTLGSAGLLFLFTREVFGRTTALLTFALLLLAPFVWFMGASFMNHVSALFFTSLALYLLALWEKRDLAFGLVGAAAALGAVFVIRPMDALAVGAVLGGWAAWRGLRSGRLAALGFAALAGLR